MKAPNVKCEFCGNDFYKHVSEIKRRKHHFCTVRCSNLSKRGNLKKSLEVQCLNCNKTFSKPSCLVKNSDKHFCNRECFAKYKTTKVKIQCKMCNEDFFIKKHKYENFEQNFFCSRACSGKHHTKKVEVICLVCDKKFLKPFDRIAKRPRHCCSPECAIELVKFQKGWGGRRSKLEIYVEEKLKKEFDLKFLFNETTIGYELDIHIPEIDLAIEINGITHYEPIYGEDIFKKRQYIDGQKIKECLSRNIKLEILKVSRDKNYPQVLEKRYQEIKNMIQNRINYLETIQQKMIVEEF